MAPIGSDERPTAIISLNYHQDHFGHLFGIRTADGEVAHTACVGFGLERIALALYRRHGFDRATWSAIRARGARPVMLRLWNLDPAAYARHPLHCADRAWPESNCYVDLWVELLHTAGAEPLAALPFALAVDVEGDQWTFFKFPLADLEALYGVSVFELNVWRPLVVHVAEQLALGRPSIVEVDAFYLPDTAGTSYRCRARQDVDRDSGASTRTAGGSATSTTRATTS